MCEYASLPHEGFNHFMSQRFKQKHREMMVWDSSRTSRSLTSTPAIDCAHESGAKVAIKRRAGAWSQKWRLREGREGARTQRRWRMKENTRRSKWSSTLLILLFDLRQGTALEKYRQATGMETDEARRVNTGTGNKSIHMQMTSFSPRVSVHHHFPIISHRGSAVVPKIDISSYNMHLLTLSCIVRLGLHLRPGIYYSWSRNTSWQQICNWNKKQLWPRLQIWTSLVCLTFTIHLLFLCFIFPTMRYFCL